MKKGINQTITLIIAIVVMVIVALALIIVTTGNISSFGENSNSKANSALDETTKVIDELKNKAGFDIEINNEDYIDSTIIP